MPLDSRRSPKPVSPRPVEVSAEPTLRDIPIPPAEPPVKRVLPWMGLILFCTGAVFQAGRLVERLDPQPLPSRGALPGMLAGDLGRSAPAPVAPSLAPPAPELPPEVLGKLRAEHDQAQELARQAWQKQVEAEVAAQVARLGEASSQQKQLETDELSRKATQAASEAEAKVRALELQLATKTAELEEARLRAENAWLRAQLVRERVGPQEAEAPAKEAEVAVGTPGAEASPESAPPAPTAALEPPASPSPESAPSAPLAEPQQPPEPTPPAAAGPAAL